jgi:hypothetical protein
MPNTLNIPERTLAQIGDSTNSINVIGGVNGRRSAYQPLVCRITDHKDNVTGETGSDTNHMALFTSQAHGHPWVKDVGLTHRVYRVGANPASPATPTDCTVIFPNFNYATFS